MTTEPTQTTPLTHDDLFAPLVHFTRCRRIRPSEVCSAHPNAVVIRSAWQGLIFDAFESKCLERLRAAAPTGAVIEPKVMHGRCGACGITFSLTCAHVEMFVGGRPWSRVYELSDCRPEDVIFESRVTHATIDRDHKLWSLYLTKFRRDPDFVMREGSPMKLGAGSPHWESIDWGGVNTEGAVAAEGASTCTH